MTTKEASELASLERRVELALEVAAAGSPPAPLELRELLLDAIARLRALEPGSVERPNAVESIERALAALDAWRRWKPRSEPTA